MKRIDESAAEYAARHARYMKERYRSFIKKAVGHLGGACVECGTTDGLEIDHIDPAQKEFRVTRMASMRWSRAEKELRKCQVLCDRHHNEKSLRERGGPSRHGTIAKYQNHGCRCVECRAAKRAYMREYRRLKGRLTGKSPRLERGR